VLFAVVVFFVPTFGGVFLESPNFEPAQPLNTPEHIAPVWYFTPFYAILRAIPDPQFGALAMALSLVCFIVLPWLDRSPVKSTRYRGWMWKLALGLFVIAFVTLGYLGLAPPSPTRGLIAQIATGVYFAFFVLMPWYTRLDPVKPVPSRVSFHHE